MQQIVAVEAAGPLGAINVLGESLDILWSRELVIFGCADIDEGANWVLVLLLGCVVRRRGGGCRSSRACWIKGGVVDTVAINFANVEILLDLGDFFWNDAVGDAPDFAILGSRMGIGEGGPKGPLDEGDDTAWFFRSATVVLAVCTIKEERANISSVAVSKRSHWISIFLSVPCLCSCRSAGNPTSNLATRGTLICRNRVRGRVKFAQYTILYAHLIPSHGIPSQQKCSFKFVRLSQDSALQIQSLARPLPCLPAYLIWKDIKLKS